ncbi:MAG TPA: hypothetical protein VGZ22_27705 [Isosphaeraceae bacterium]|jgi:hypothetical protein|nr:hypothetical protein [Isosphaeraceae bacterium]
MQGTIVMLMALSGLGCHHKNCCGVAVAPACYSATYASGCYASAQAIGGGCYGSAQSMGGCYGGPSYGGYAMPLTYGGCYSDYVDNRNFGCYGGGCYGGSGYGGWYGGCYGGSTGCGHHGGGLFGWCHRRRSCNACCGGLGVASTGFPVYGSYTPVYGSGQVSPQTMASPAPVTQPAAESAPSTPPPAAAPANPTPPTDNMTAPPGGAQPPPAPAPGGDTTAPPAANPPAAGDTTTPKTN